MNNSTVLTLKPNETISHQAFYGIRHVVLAPRSRLYACVFVEDGRGITIDDTDAKGACLDTVLVWSGPGPVPPWPPEEQA